MDNRQCADALEKIPVPRPSPVLLFASALQGTDLAGSSKQAAVFPRILAKYSSPDTWQSLGLSHASNALTLSSVSQNIRANKDACLIGLISLVLNSAAFIACTVTVQYLHSYKIFGKIYMLLGLAVRNSFKPPMGGGAAWTLTPENGNHQHFSSQRSCDNGGACMGTGS